MANQVHRLATSAIALSSVVALLTPATASAEISSPCRAPGTLVEANASAAITKVKFRRGGPQPGRWGCAKGRKAIPLEGTGPADTFDFTGKFVALGKDSCSSSSGCAPIIDTINLATGKRVRVTSGPNLDQALFAGRHIPVTVQTTSTGVVYWITKTPVPGPPSPTEPPSNFEVYRGDRQRVVRRLDSGVGIDPSSLGVAGQRAFWINNGAPMTAT